MNSFRNIIKSTLTRYIHSQGVLNSKINQKAFILKDLLLEEEAEKELSRWELPKIWKLVRICKNDLKGSYSQHRINYLAKELETTEETIIKLIPKCNFLLNKSFHNFKHLIEMLKNCKVKPSDILSDPWILQYNPDKVANRLKILKESDVDEIKPWMARCSQKIFDSFLARESRRQELLGNHSVEEYISQRLGCSPMDIRKILMKQSQMQKTSILKMKKILDFLFLNGFSAEHILLGLPRIAHRNIETIQTRLTELSHAGIPKNLLVIARSKKDYEEYMWKWKTRVKQDNK